jgi:SAM-dependent methyltransferase
MFMKTTLGHVFGGLILSALLIQPSWAEGVFGDEKYRPEVGQEGKDVIWVPTHDELVEKMLEVAKVTESDVVYDLGAGDGKIPIFAARKYGSRAVGIEYNKEMADLAVRNSQRAGVADKVKIIHGDIFKEDFSEASVVTLYLLPDLNLKLRPTILAMKPGTRVVSHAFHMGDWEPDQKIDTPRAHAFYWVVPAAVKGRWEITGVNGQPKATLILQQRYQKIAGTLTIGRTTQPILGAQLRADRIEFRYIDSAGQLQTVNATITGNTLEGDARSGDILGPIRGERR